ncbi:MmgE/PrpD family protein [Achromobacter sp. GG226]|uniref:MmgE/PrpD family protein n=1 Tax=Verticiella alkaliphila TaxID=2779529 RepID=UPI001C0D3010|nr:MmgE/PrpD family protein [Verticiella sp. GG226]MBU4609682.1 MmgE/PrpD family protein [Verticiella sp. GG226]
MMTQSISATLARLCLHRVQDHDRARAALHVRDWYACALAGTTLPVAHTLWAGARGLAGDADPWAALGFEASLGTLLEMDDIDRAALCHPGPVIVPAALFLGRRLGSSGRQVLDAVVRGYEAAIRVGRATGPRHYAYWHPTSTCGSLGAAVAAASLLAEGRPDTHDLLAHALGLAATRASGLWQVRLEPNSAKPWHTAQAAQTGVQAALQASAGLTAPAHMLEGTKGFFAALAPDGDAAHVISEPVDHWRIHDTSFKPWPACRHTHPAIAATLALRDGFLGRSAALPAIQTLTVRTYADALDFCNNPHPTDAAQARFSLQHTLAVAWLRGEPRLADFQPAALTDPAIVALRQQVRLIADADCQARYPAHFGALVEAVQPEGSGSRAHCADAPGDPEDPLSETALLAKLADAATSAGWATPQIEALALACASLPHAPDLRQLPGLLPAGPVH